jgi:streptogramin lyase
MHFPVIALVRLVAVSLMALVGICSSAQHSEADFGSSTGEWNYSARSWQSQNGLAGETVQAFAQTSDGFLWVGTTEGLLRFDGAQFTLFSHENTPAMRENSVFCLLASRDGGLWIGTDGGGLLEMRNGNSRAFTAADGLTDGFIRALLEDREGQLWVATDSGLFTGKNGKFKRVDNTGFSRIIRDVSGQAPRKCTPSGMAVQRNIR